MGPEGPEKHREIGEVEAGSEAVRIVAAQATRLALEKWNTEPDLRPGSEFLWRARHNLGKPPAF
jgi:hypothetical protein